MIVSAQVAIYPLRQERLTSLTPFVYPDFTQESLGRAVISGRAASGMLVGTFRAVRRRMSVISG
jgi:hypothetical protein